MLSVYSGFVAGTVCDVGQFKDVEYLASFAQDQFGGSTPRRAIDIWINNAGQSQDSLQALADVDAAVIQSIIQTNLMGTLFGTKVATQVMEEQSEGGHIFLMEGAGSNGMVTAQFATYGVSKAGFPQLLKSLVKENRSSKVGIHALSPGMVITDLLMKSPPNSIEEAAKRPYRIFNILAEKPSTVASWLVPRIEGATRPGSTGTAHRYLTPLGVVWRFLTFFTRRNRLIDEKTGRIL